MLADGTGLVANHQFYLASRAFADAHPERRRRACSTSWPRSIDWAHGQSAGGGRASSGAARSASRPRCSRSALERHGLRRRADRPTRSSAQQQTIADAFHELGLIPKPIKVARRRVEAGQLVKRRRADRSAERPLVPADPWRRPLSRHQPRRRATVDLRYLRQIAQAADQLGYFGVLLPTGRSCEDCLGRRLGAGAADRAAALPRRRAARPAAPTVAARMAATLDRISERAAADQRRHRRRPGREQGRRHLPRPRRALRGDARVPRVCAALLAGETVDFDGKHLRSRTGRLLFPPVQKPYPPLYFGGSSEAGDRGRGRARRQLPDLGRAARRRSREDRDVRAAAPRSAGRTLQLRHPPARHRARDRRARPGRAADELISHVDDETIAAAQATFARMDSVGQQRMARAARRPPRQARGQPQPVGRRRPGARRRRHRAGRRSRRRWPRACSEYMRARHRHLHPLRLSASRGGLPLRRARLPAAAAGAPTRPRAPRRRSTRARSARCIANDIRSSCGSATGARRERRRAAHAGCLAALAPWLLPVALVAGLGGGRRSGLLSARVLPAPSARRAGVLGRCASRRAAAATSPISTERALIGLAIGGGLGFAARLLNGIFAAGRDAARHHAADAAQRAASRASSRW